MQNNVKSVENISRRNENKTEHLQKKTWFLDSTLFSVESLDIGFWLAR